MAKRKHRRNPRISMSWVSKWRLYSYDVWGNAKDGYEVNDVFRTDTVVEIPNVLMDSDKEIINWLKKEGVIKKSVRLRNVQIDGDNRVMYFSYKDKPEFELRWEGRGGYIEV